jgi:hypothetical protein
MIYIAHRGNCDGPDEINENKPEYLLNAIAKGFYVETDLWVINDILYLGHNKPDYKIEIGFLLDIKNKLFCHCKNIDALYFLVKNYSEIECFFHNDDECVLTSKNKIWNYTGKTNTPLSICVMPEKFEQQFKYNWYGVCSDFVNKLKDNERIT